MGEGQKAVTMNPLDTQENVDGGVISDAGGILALLLGNTQMSLGVPILLHEPVLLTLTWLVPGVYVFNMGDLV